MTTRVVGTHEISLNEVRFPIVGKVRSSIASSYPPAQRRFSSIVWRDHGRGMGTNRVGPEGPFNTCWDTIWDIRNPGHLSPGGHINETNPSLSTGGGSGVSIVGELDGLLVSSSGTAIYSFVFGGGGWTQRDSSVPAAPVDVKNLNLDGTEYLVYAFGNGGFTYADAIATWADNTGTLAENVEVWDDRIWSLALDGRLRRMRTINGAANSDKKARVFLSHGEVITGLFQARTKANNEAFILYATTSKRLLAHDLGYTRFVEITDVQLGDNNEVSHERPTTVFKGKIYLASGRSITEYDPLIPSVRQVGFDMDDGLPAGLDGRITAMVSNATEMFVGTKAVKSGTDTAVVMGWDGRGWRRVWTDPDTTEVVDSLHVGRMPSTSMGATEGGDVEYLWIGTTSRVHHVLINNSQTRSANINGWISANVSGEHPFRQHILPIFSDPEHKTIALRLKIQTAGHSSTVSTKVYVDFDQAGQTQMTNPEFTTNSTFSAGNNQIEGNGTTTFTFPSGQNNSAGTEFKDIQIAVEYSSSTTTKGLDIYSITLEYLAIEEDREAFEFTLDFNHGPLSPQGMRAAFITAKKLVALPEFTFRDDDGNDRNVFVKIIGGEGDEETGLDERGQLAVRVETI